MTTLFKIKRNTALAPICICILSFFTISCEDFISVGPPKTQIVSSTVFSDDATAVLAIKGIYSEMINNTGFADGGLTSVSVLTGMSSDELISYHTNNDLSSFYKNSLLPTNATLLNNIWRLGFKYIYYSNTVLEGLNASSELTPATVAQLEGEAKFIRAFCYFYLVNLFGDLPLITTTDYRVNAVLKRVEVSKIMELMVSDLTDAQNLLPSDYSASAGAERIRPNKWAATAMLARVYLFAKDWGKAESESTKIINNTGLYSILSNPSAVFQKNSLEAIWQLKPVNGTSNTREGNVFILQSVPSNVSLTTELVNAFETGDKRKSAWIGSFVSGSNSYFYPFKYKIKSGGTPLNEYSMVIRLAEVYLIRAEARAQQNNISASIADVNVIRNRAGLPLLINMNQGLSQSDMLSAIEQERRVELFTEWGHRWLDLKRTERADFILSQTKEAWRSNDVLYPLPQSELDANVNLAPQNAGY